MPARVASSRWSRRSLARARRQETAARTPEALRAAFGGRLARHAPTNAAPLTRHSRPRQATLPAKHLLAWRARGSAFSSCGNPPKLAAAKRAHLPPSSPTRPAPAGGAATCPGLPDVCAARRRGVQSDPPPPAVPGEERVRTRGLWRRPSLTHRPAACARVGHRSRSIPSEAKRGLSLQAGEAARPPPTTLRCCERAHCDAS
mmetsp:Transcript_41296/g.97115  ORF Transcript_41296/g.97115 Transcript_41296/m.97115 type:complete len:202 (+) Transcript_41296:46-651(+)